MGRAIAITIEQCWQRTPGGSGTYIAELTRALTALETVSLVGIAARHHHDELPDPDFFPTVDRVAMSRLPRPLLYEAWNRAHLPHAERIAGSGIDVVHATTWAIPPTSKPLVVTVHDVAFITSPSSFSRRGVRFFERSLARTRAEADRVIVPSQITSEACIAAGVRVSSIRIVPHGVRVIPPTQAGEADFRSKHGLTRPYILWCGTLEPRKNLRTLLEAFAHAQETLADHLLVLVGPQGWGDLELGAPDETGRVRWLGRLSSEELACAYAGADVFCFPSLAEGFGMPVLEAMAHGVPVVTSLGTPMEEIVGDAGIAVESTNSRAMADALIDVSENRASLTGAARARADTYSWATAAARTNAVYDELA